MAKYRVQGPDGRIHVFEGPDGASPADVESFASQTFDGTKQAEPKYDPTEGMSTFDKVAAGAGKAVVDTGRGIGQMLGLVSRDDVAESRKRDEALMNTTGAKVGNLVGNVAMLAPTAMIPGANTVTGAATIGALTGLAQPSTSTGETIANLALGGAGGAGGQAIANKVGNIVKQAGTELSLGQQASAKAGQDIGMRLTPGKASGSTVLQKLEAAAESNPMTAGGFDSIKQGNQKALNRAAAKAIGESADELSTPVLARAEQRIGQVFESVKDKTPVPLDTVTNKLAALIQDTEGMIGQNGSLAENGLIKRLGDFTAQGGATREQLRDLSSKLGKMGKTNMTTQTGDRELGQALFAAQDLVEDSIQGTLSKAQQAAYAEARGQYKNLMNLTAKTNVVNPSSGNVSGRGLANTLMQKDRGGFTMGRNETDLYNAARFVQAFPDIVGNSGTATRSMGAADYVTGLPGNMLTRLYLSRPVAAAASAGAGMIGTAARLADPVLNKLAMPLGSMSGLGAANLVQQY
jgi:hypothetical protein